jgi:uncharacterized protein (DUF934 family)
MPDSNLISGSAIAADEWNYVMLPAAAEENVRKQAGKVVLFKLTGEGPTTPEQVAGTQIPATGKVLVPLAVWLARKAELTERMAQGEVGVWLATHELIESLVEDQPDLNVFPIIGVYVERSADGRIFSLGTLLRTRYGYSNEMRAFGDVLRDQLFFLKRCGFDSFLIRADRSAMEALASLQEFTEPYQGAIDITQPVWRRINRNIA